MIPIDWPSTIRAMLIIALFEGTSTSLSSACLLGVSSNDILSIGICSVLILFSILYGFIAFRSKDKFIRVCSIVITVLMPIAGTACILVDEDFITTNTAIIKSPLYIIISISILINLSVDIILIINSCRFQDIKNRLFTNNNQMTYFLLINIVIGFALGLSFGFLRINNKLPTSAMAIVTLAFLLVGIVVGAVFGFLNERDTQKFIILDPSMTMSAGDYDRV